MADVDDGGQANPEPPVDPPVDPPSGNEPPKGGEPPKGDEPPKEKEGVVPEKYDLKLAKDTILDQSDMERIATEAKELGLTNEEAQDLLDLESSAQARYQDKQTNEVKGIREGWVKTAEEDKEIGGDVFKESVALSARVIEKFGTDDFKKALDETGFGNHPEVIRIFTRIGKLMGNDQLVMSKGQSPGEKSLEETFYGKTE
jgi:hypothetical protein